MKHWTRRGFIAGAGLGLAGCTAGARADRGARIDQRVDLAMQQMFDEIPGTRDLVNRAAGVLVMPTITKAGLMFGGAYGEGALLIGNAPVDYYSIAQGNYGIQFGLQQYAHTLFFMNEDSLGDFRASRGWQVGADMEYVVRDRGDNLSVDTTELRSPVLAAVYGRAGLIVGATLEGTKYTRVVR